MYFKIFNFEENGLFVIRPCNIVNLILENGLMYIENKPEYPLFPNLCVKVLKLKCVKIKMDTLQPVLE